MHFIFYDVTEFVGQVTVLMIRNRWTGLFEKKKKKKTDEMNDMKEKGKNIFSNQL